MLESEKMKLAKEKLIREWMSLRDEADSLNKKMYELSCEIEGLNAQITEQLRKEALEIALRKKPPPSNGAPRS